MVVWKKESWDLGKELQGGQAVVKASAVTPRSHPRTKKTEIEENDNPGDFFLPWVKLNTYAAYLFKNKGLCEFLL